MRFLSGYIRKLYLSTSSELCYRTRMESSTTKNVSCDNKAMSEMEPAVATNLGETAKEKQCASNEREDGIKSKEKFKSKRKENMKQRKWGYQDSTAKIDKRPTHFLAVQIKSPVIKGAMKAVQDCMVAKSNLLKNVVVEVELAHITLGLLHLPDEDSINEASEILQECKKDLVSILDDEFLHLKICGIGHFNRQVVFAKIFPGENERKLYQFAEYFDVKFEKLKSINTFKYLPHITLMKLSKLRSFAMKKKIGKIDPKLFRNFNEIDFGEEKIGSVQLLAMARRKGATYYHCESAVSLECENDDIPALAKTTGDEIDLEGKYSSFLSSYKIASVFCDMADDMEKDGNSVSVHAEQVVAESSKSNAAKHTTNENSNILGKSDK